MKEIKVLLIFKDKTEIIVFLPEKTVLLWVQEKEFYKAINKYANFYILN